MRLRKYVSKAPSLEWRRLAEAMPQLVWTCASDGRCDYLSPRWTEYTGCAAEELLGHGWLERIHRDDVESARASWRACIARGVPFCAELRLRSHDGSYRWFRAQAVPERDPKGSVRRWYGNTTDVQELHDAAAQTACLEHELERRVAQRTEALQAEARELEAQGRRMQAAQRLTSVGSWELEVATGQVSWSDEVCRLFGADAREPVPDLAGHAPLFEPESWTRLEAAIAHSLATAEGYELHLTAIRRNGARRSAVARAETVRDGAGRVERVVGAFQDVTPRTALTAELRQASHRLLLATSAAKIGVWEWDVLTNGVVWHETMWQPYQVPRSAALPYAILQGTPHPDDLDEFDRQLSASLADGQEFQTTVRIARPDGAERHVRTLASFERDPSGRAVRMTGVNWDITDQRTAELALQQAEALLHAILAHAGPAIIAIDSRGLVRLFNRAAEELLGYRAEEVVGQVEPAQFHDPDEVGARRAALERELGRSTESVEVFTRSPSSATAEASEWTYVRKDGARVPVLLTVSPVRVGAHTVVGHLVVAFDLTRRKSEERELRELNGLLGQRTRQMEVLLQEVHHRVKNNLQVIASLVNMQGRQVGDQGARAALADCRTRVLAIALIHEQLYKSNDYSRVPVSDYVRQLTRDVFAAATATTKHVQLVREVESVLLPVEQAIPCGLIVNELMTNALKHAFPDHRPGTVTVALQRTPRGELSLSVADDGIGLPPSIEPGSGFALGMQLVFDLARQLRGRVEILRSHGTRVSVSFPPPESSA